MLVTDARRFLLAAALACAAPTAGYAADSAVVFVYHRFGDAAFPSTSIRTDQFAAHIQELSTGGYTVLPLAEIAARLKSGQGVPDRTVGLSVDDGYRSAYDVAWPLLRRANMPFTVFVTTDSIGTREMMSWDQLRELRRAGIAIGGHTASHPHMAASSAAKNRAELEKSRRVYQAELGELPRIFAYPYGEYTLAIKPLIAEFGYDFAFGEHSGAIGPTSDFFFLPRFTMNEKFGEIDRFRLAARAFALPVHDVTPADTLVGPRNNPPAFGFTVDRSAGALDSLRCYADGQKVDLQRLGDRRVELRVERPYPPGRVRINCTLPAAGGTWRWLGTQFFVTKN